VNGSVILYTAGHVVEQLFEVLCSKIAVSIPDVIIGIFH
jgi:hypothetical protein